MLKKKLTFFVIHIKSYTFLFVYRSEKEKIYDDIHLGKFTLNFGEVKIQGGKSWEFCDLIIHDIYIGTRNCADCQLNRLSEFSGEGRDMVLALIS